jgi:hypothetical protein
MNNNFIGALIAILVSILFAMNLNNKKENYAGGMPPRKVVAERVAAFNPVNNTDPNKVHWYSVSNFQSNPSQRGTNPEVGPHLRTKLNSPARLSNDIRLPNNNNKLESFKQNYTENFENMVQENYSTYQGLPVVDPSYAAGNFNSNNKDIEISNMMPIPNMSTTGVDDEGNPGNILFYDRYHYSNLKSNRNERDSDFIRGDLPIPPQKGSCWFGQRGYSLRPSALGVLGGGDSESMNKLKAITTPGYRNINTSFSAASGDLIVENQTR